MSTTLISTALCFLANASTAPPGVTLQGVYISAYNVDRKLCPPVRDTEVMFFLYRRASLSNPKQLKLNDDNLLQSAQIDFNKKTVIFFHGFLESHESIDAQDVKNAYLQKEDCNVILVNAKILFAGLNYITAANNVEAVGKYAALFIDYLVSKGLQLSKFEVAGMSLGGQTAGIVGANVKSGNITKLIAYDPAGPLFNLYPENKRLTKDNADLVIVIHSNPNVNGYGKSCGDVDFWINGHTLIQPGCSPIETSIRKPGNIPELAFCSHYLSYRMAVYAITHPEAFPARQCSSYDNYKNGACDNNDLQYLGDQVTSTANGDYYLTVGSNIYAKLGLS